MQIQKGLECLQRMDSTIPPEYHDEFSRIAPIFIEPYYRFMQTVRGPAYTPPALEHVHLSPSAKRPLVADSFSHNVVDMTQPPQHISADLTEPSSSRPKKMTIRRPAEQKWLISKRLTKEKMDTIRRDWGWGKGMTVGLEGGIRHDLMFTLAPISIQSLAPGGWLDDRIIYTYMVQFLFMLSLYLSLFNVVRSFIFVFV